MDVLQHRALTPRSPGIAEQLKADYTLTDLVALEKQLAPAVEIKLNPLDRVCASARRTEGQDPTNYDAVWVRDSVWAYYGLCHTQPGDAKLVLQGLLQYFAIPAQRARLSRVIENPELANSANGAMEVPHIRYDGRSPAFSDVQVAGHDQIWNHKQNDAVALTALAAGEALLGGVLRETDIPGESWEFLLRLPTYWDRIGFDSCEDAGAWEEIERVNTSSVALVTSSLEIWRNIAAHDTWGEKLLRHAAKLKLDIETETFFNGGLAALIDRGYARLRKQLPFESPDYPADSPKYRRADAALLNLVFPCELSRLTLEDKRAVLSTVEELVEEVGILRYRGDSYQAGNYWTQEETGAVDSRTDDHSGQAAFADRAKRMSAGTEAQWFFDSWASQCYGLLYQQSGEPGDYQRQVAHFNRALAQITGPRDVGADGQPVDEFSLPESYNTRLEGDRRWFSPSPITPLNWSKACLILALDALQSSLRLKTQ